jgi:hypothetical protein
MMVSMILFLSQGINSKYRFAIYCKFPVGKQVLAMDFNPCLNQF